MIQMYQGIQEAKDTMIVFMFMENYWQHGEEGCKLFNIIFVKVDVFFFFFFLTAGGGEHDIILILFSYGFSIFLSGTFEEALEEAGIWDSQLGHLINENKFLFNTTRALRQLVFHMLFTINTIKLCLPKGKRN